MYYQNDLNPTGDFIIKLRESTGLRLSIQPNIYNCSVTTHENENEYSCNITQDYYYPVHQYYNFTLTRNNSFGVLIQNFIINHNDRVKLSKPNFTLENATYNSLNYLIHLKRKWLPNRYYYEVEIKYATEYRENRTSDRTSDNDFILYGYVNLYNNADFYLITLEKLPYAYAWYDVRMRFRIRTNEKNNTMWSDNFNITSQTSAKIPDKPPKTDIGSFFIDDSNRKVNLYWETLAKYEFNGKNFDYIVKHIFVNNKQTKVSSIDSSLNAVAYEYNSTNKYEFHIKSINEMGESENFSVIKIPARMKVPKDSFLPRSFNKILHNNRYELTWDEPGILSNSTYRLKDYTVFWCKPAQEIHTDCEKSAEGFIHFLHVDKNDRFFTKPKTNITHNLNFGVSANYEDFSSGIVWAPCTGQTNSDFEEIQILSYTPDKQSITIFWSLNCVMNTIIKGYNLTYCIFKENLMEETMKNEPNCSEPEKFLEIPKSEAPGKYILKNLKPHKQYKININIYSDTKSGPKMSKPVYYTTLEAAPSTPKNLRLVNKTSNYAIIQWDVPENKNGIIKNYEIFYNENSVKLDNKHFSESDTTIIYKLEHLRSFHNYKVYVTAYTVASSNQSNDLTFQTWIGTPDSLKPGFPNKTEQYNKKQIVWDPPLDPASSKISFYKVTIQSESFHVESYVERNQCTLKPVCSTFKIKAAAVNAIPKEQFDYERFEHSQFLLCDKKNLNFSTREQDSVISYKDLICEEDKSSVFPTYCGSKNYKFLAGNDELIYTYECSLANKQLTQTIFLSIAGVLGIIMSLIFVLLGVKKFRKMKNIDFELPPGLADLDQLDPNKNCSQGKPINEKQTIERANENLHLLSSIDNLSNPYINCSGSEKSVDVNCGNDNIDNDRNFMRRGNSLEMVSDSNSSNHSSRSQSPSMSIGSEKEMAYILPQNDSLNRSNNNISINDGYVQQSLLENSIPPVVSSNNGYSTIEALQPTSIQPTIITNPIQNMPVSNIDNSHYVNPNSIGKPKVFMTSTTNPQNPTLAGYVTHKQLSDYGQQKRH